MRSRNLGNIVRNVQTANTKQLTYETPILALEYSKYNKSTEELHI